MSSRPRRSAAQRATVAITDLADRDAGVMSSRSRSKLPRGESATGDDSQHMHLTVKVNSSKLRQATNTGRGSAGNQISVAGRASAASRRPTRGAKKRYVESESDEDEEDEVAGDDDDDDDDDDEDDDDEEEEEEEEDEIQVGEEDEELEEDEDAEGEVVEEEDAMDIDAEGEDEELGEEDAEGDIDMDVTPAPLPPTIKISKPAKSSGGSSNGRARSSLPPRASAKSSNAQKVAAALADDDDDDEEELSELDSDVEDEINDTVEVGGQEVVDEDADGEPEEEEADADMDVDVDAEGEEIEVADEEEDDEEGLDSAGDTPGDGSRAGTPDLSKMTRRQRARFEETPQEYMKLSDEVQVKKHFTAEEISMRRQEMARRRRNLSEKRNEEVKTETINKLLKRQAPKNNKRGGQAGDETPDAEAQRPDPLLIRWISSREGSRTAVPQELLDGPAGRAFHGGPSGNLGGRMVQEVT